MTMQKARAKLPQQALIALLWDGYAPRLSSFSYAAADPQNYVVEAVQMDKGGDVLVDIRLRDAEVKPQEPRDE